MRKSRRDKMYAERLKTRLLKMLQDSKQASGWITEFFENVEGADVITLRIINKDIIKGFPKGFIDRIGNTQMEDWTNDDDPFELGDFEEFDPLRDDFQDWVQDELNKQEDTWDNDTGDEKLDWLQNRLEDEHHKNRAKRKKEFKKIKDKNHPMETLNNDNVGIFPIAYVEYLEKQNDLLRENAKGGKNGKRKNTK